MGWALRGCSWGSQMSLGDWMHILMHILYIFDVEKRRRDLFYIDSYTHTHILYIQTYIYIFMHPCFCTFAFEFGI